MLAQQMHYVVLRQLVVVAVAQNVSLSTLVFEPLKNVFRRGGEFERTPLTCMFGNLNIKRLMVNGESPTGVRLAGLARSFGACWQDWNSVIFYRNTTKDLGAVREAFQA